MKLSIRAILDYRFDHPTDVLVQLEVAALPEQRIDFEQLYLSERQQLTRVPAQDNIGERLWLHVDGRLHIQYDAIVTIAREVIPCADLAQVPLCDLPASAVQYLMGSRYCPSDQFQRFVEAEFGDVHGGARIAAMRDWIEARFRYAPGVSNDETTASDTFVRREGICRDFAHVMISLARASGIPARIASVYALGVVPQDFHAVAEVFLGGAWHLVDATGMAKPAGMAKIGIGRDAADVAFLTSYGPAQLTAQSVSVFAAD